MSSAGGLGSVRSAFVYNRATGSSSRGGGVQVASGSRFSDVRSVYSHNAAVSGGGLSMTGTATVDVAGSVMYDNAATNGGGLACDGESSVTIQGMAGLHALQHAAGHVTFLQNTASVVGAGSVFLACRAQLVNVSHTGNSMRQASRFSQVLGLLATEMSGVGFIGGGASRGASGADYFGFDEAMTVQVSVDPSTTAHEQSPYWEADGSDTVLVVDEDQRLYFRSGPMDRIMPAFRTKLRTYSVNPLSTVSLSADGISSGNGAGMYVATTADAAESLEPLDSSSIRVRCFRCRFVGNLALDGLGGAVYAAGATDDDECTEVPATCTTGAKAIKATYFSFLQSCPQDFQQNYAGGSGPDVSWTQIEPTGLLSVLLNDDTLGGGESVATPHTNRPGACDWDSLEGPSYAEYSFSDSEQTRIEESGASNRTQEFPLSSMPTNIGFVPNYGVETAPEPGSVLAAAAATTTTTTTTTSGGGKFEETDVTSNFGESTLAVELRDRYGYRVDATQFGQLIVRATLSSEETENVGQYTGDTDSGTDRRRLRKYGRRLGARRLQGGGGGDEQSTARQGEDAEGNFLDGTVTAVLSEDGVAEFNQLEFRGRLEGTATFQVYIDPSLGVSAFGTVLQVADNCTGRSEFDEDGLECKQCGEDSEFSNGRSCFACPAGTELYEDP